MKITGKITTFVLAAILSGSCFSTPLNHISAESISASAAVYDEVPDGYTGIYTIDDLYAVRNNLSGKYILMNDIDLSATAPSGDWDNGNGWLPIDNFKGTFDGNGYAIKNMHIYGDFGNKEAILGLFGYIGDDSYNPSKYVDLRRIAIVDCDIDVSGSGELFVGSVVGWFHGCNMRLQECYSTGNIKITHTGNEEVYTGGICGFFENRKFDYAANSIFNICEISVNSSSDRTYIGGICGSSSYSRMINTYNAGRINYEYTGENSPSKYVGNIDGHPHVGSNYASTNSYYLKNLSDYTAFGYAGENKNIFDGDVSNVAGLTEAQMKSKAAFIGFDFDKVWTIDSNAEYQYPTLREVPYVSTQSSTTEPTQPTTTQPITTTERITTTQPPTTTQWITTTERTTTTQPTTTTQWITTTERTTTTQPPVSAKSKKGDMNGDGIIDAADASLILSYYAYISTGGTITDFDMWFNDSNKWSDTW